MRLRRFQIAASTLLATIGDAHDVDATGTEEIPMACGLRPVRLSRSRLAPPA